MSLAHARGSKSAERHVASPGRFQEASVRFRAMVQEDVVRRSAVGEELRGFGSIRPVRGENVHPTDHRGGKGL